jgi:hypothetical protein
MRFLGVLLALVVFTGCGNTKKEKKIVNIGKGVSGSDLTVSYDSEKKTVEVRTDKKVRIIFHLPKAIEDESSLEKSLKTFNFDKLDSGTNEQWLENVAATKTETPKADCEELTLDSPPVLIKQHKDGSLYVELKQGKEILMSAKAKRNSSPGFCVVSWQGPEMVDIIARGYTGIYQRFLAAIGQGVTQQLRGDDNLQPDNNPK